MKVTYEAFDGTKFNNELECLDYEREKGKADIIMLDHSGNSVKKTNSAAFVWLRDEYSAALFHSLAIDCGDLAAASSIQEGECGFFFWDECANKYQCISEDAIDGLIALRAEVM